MKSIAIPIKLALKFLSILAEQYVLKPKQDSIFESNPLKTLVILLIIFLTIFDIAAANIYHLFKGHGFFDTPYEKYARIERSYRIKSNIYHHDLKKKSFVKNARWGMNEYTILTDSLGFKSKYVQDTPLISTNKRIVFIGDSFTEGAGVEYQNSFVGLVTNELVINDIEVLNAGVVSYSPIIYWRKIKFLLEDVGLKFDELVVFIDISDIDDEANYYYLSSDGVVKGRVSFYDPSYTIKYFIKNNTLLTYFFMDTFHDLMLPSANKPAASRPLYDMAKRSTWTVNKQYYNEFGKKGLESARHYLDLLSSLLKKHNIKLTISVHPWPAQIKYNDLNSIQVKYWRKWAEDANTTFLNFFPCFIHPENTEYENKITLDKYFFTGDVHWNKAGHRLIADNYLSQYINNSNSDSSSCVESVSP